MRSILLHTLLALATLAPAVLADGRNPGSLIVYPEFDHSSGHNTLLTVTNTKLDASVRVMFKYVSGENNATRCKADDRVEVLSPGDTLTVLTSAHDPGVPQRGFVYVFAVDNANRPVSFNFLVGDLIQLNGSLALQYAVTPLPFKAIPAQGANTDLENGGVGDGVRDLDGVEYEQAPAQVLIPRFLGQSAAVNSDLVLISLTGGEKFTTLVQFLVYNDNEEIYSAQASFACWTKKSLLELNGVFANTFLHDFTNDAVGEIAGWGNQEAGWMSIDGVVANSISTTILDPAVLAVLIERPAAGALDRGAELPFFQGKQANGDLIPTTNAGDP